MRTLKNLLAASAASLLSTAAFAADLPIAPPPMYAPPPVEDFGGWYLRGDIGFSNQKLKGLDNLNYYDPGISVAHQGLGFDAAGIYGIGAGYQFNNWFRADITGEYRGRANFHGTDLMSFNGVASGVNNYGGSKSEWLFLANAYADLGTWWCITPFIGAGIGTSRNTISSFTDNGLWLGNPGSAYADTASKWNFAWAVHAGLAYRISPNLTMELAYRYVDLGDGITGDVQTYDGSGPNRFNPVTFKHITSHDLKFGVRWAIDPGPAYLPPMPPPLIRKG
jgi:opacity protein-like surface antigen